MTAVLSHPRYRLDRLIATGGMGEVWAATDTVLERDVAVKLLKREYADDPVFRARFAAEARHAGALQHPHVAAVLDYGELPGEDRAPVPFLVMELVEGRPLSALLAAGGALEPEVAAELIAQAAEGLAAAHAIGIVHRDVKPGNLLVTGEGQVKVTDFGIARAADAVPLTTTGHVVGTPHYFSPEQAQGQAATPASDVYSLGIVLFECLVGAKPFVGDSPVATALKQLRDPLPPFPPQVPERLQAVVRAATSKDPAQRIRGAAELAAVLRSDDPGTQSLRLPAAASPGAAVPAAGSTPGEYVIRRRFPWLLLAGFLALALVVGGAVALTAGRGDEPPPDPGRTVAPELVRVRAAAYLGLPVVEAARGLRALGLDVRTVLRANPRGRSAATVAAVDPTGMVERGTEVILTIWREPASAPPANSEGSAGGSAGGSAEHGSAGGSSGAGGGAARTGDGPGTARTGKRASDGQGDRGAAPGRPEHAGGPGKPDHAGGPGNNGNRNHGKASQGKPGKGKPGKGKPGKGKPAKGGKG
jgi:eukaryotic-like serine/threonine-protein kinase